MATQIQRAPNISMDRLGKSMQHQSVSPDKPRVPLVGHTITDEDIGALQGSKLQPVNLNKVVKLLTDPHSAILYDRHSHVLKEVTRLYEKGFLMKDLVQIFKIINVCADRIEEQNVYVEPVIQLLHICGLPFLKEKTSDETEYQQIATEAVSQLGYLMRVPSSRVRLKICEALINFFYRMPTDQSVQKHQANTLKYNQIILEKSDVAETMVKSLALLENDMSVKVAVMNVLQVLSKHSAMNCDLMLRGDCAERICARLMDDDPTGQLLFRSVEILWNLLENGSQLEVARQISNVHCIGQLRDAFCHKLTEGYSHFDRQLRNDILILASIVASINTNAPFVETGFVKQLCLFATFEEVKSHNVLVKHFRLSHCHEDFELKKLLINILVVLTAEAAVLPILSEGHFMLALFSYVRNNETDPGPREWTPAKFEELQLQALSALCTLAPLQIEEYMTCQGSTRILMMLEWCVSKDGFVGHGNSFHGTGGRDSKRAQMRHCLRLLRSLVSTGDETVLQDLVDQGVIHQLTGILGSITTPEDEILIEMQTDMLFILSVLSENDLHRKELLGTAGVDIMIGFLKSDVKLLSGGLGHHRRMLATVDCIWCAIVGCYITEDYFLEKEGVFLLIDLLEKSSSTMHNLVLGCILDLCENPKAIPHVNTWRGADDISAAHLMCQLWRDEEQSMGVCRDSATGAISDATRPLIGLLQEVQGVVSLPSRCSSQSIVDISENMRAKIYSLFCKTGFNDLPGLTTEDHVTITIIEHYLDFKLGEVWNEVLSELEIEQVRPITPDQEAVEAIARAVDDVAVSVGQIQTELLEAQTQQDLLDEQEYMAEIRENHRQKEFAITHFNDYVARTSNYTLLKAAKERQELSVDMSRVQDSFREHDAFHKTDIANIEVTAYSGRHVTLDSTPATLTGGHLARYDPLSGTLKERKQALNV